MIDTPGMALFALACVVPSFLIALAATGAMRTLAPKWGLIDRPAARKVHLVPTPLGGGVGIWMGVVLPLAGATFAAWLLSGRESKPAWLPPEIAAHIGGVLFQSQRMWLVIAGGTILSAMGLGDDKEPLPWRPRLFVQFCVAVGLVAAGVQATVFVPLPWIGYTLSVLWIMVLVNSFNFLDNMDGLSSGIALVASVIMAAIMLTAMSEPRWLIGGVMLILAGALAGFLCHNWSPAKIFMGDSGSYFIGLLMATMTIQGTFYDQDMPSRHVILAPLCILAIPLYDFCSVMLIRLSQRRSPFQPDKSHFSHRLVELGLKPRHAVMTIHLATLTTGLGAVILYQVSDWNGALLVVALILCLLTIIAILETAGRRTNGKS